MERKQSQTHQADIQRAKHPVFTGSRNENQKDGRICRHNGFFMFECNTIFTTVQPWVQGERACRRVCVCRTASNESVFMKRASSPCSTKSRSTSQERPPPRSECPTHSPRRAITRLCFVSQATWRRDFSLWKNVADFLNFNKSEKYVFIKNVMLMFTSEQRWN